MKKLSIVVHTSLQQKLTDRLHSMHLDNFMFSNIEEQCSQLEQDAFLAARDKLVCHEPKVRVDVLLEEARDKTLLDEICGPTISFCGKGVYWISDVGELQERKAVAGD